jgi:hypothetical protein
MEERSRFFKGSACQDLQERGKSVSANGRQKKRATRRTWALYSFEGNKTSRGEQLLRWHWEEKATKMHQLGAI